MTTPVLRLITLGALDLWAPDGTELRSVLAQPRRVALLAYLALATPRRPHRRDQLLALFWPDQDQAHARNALSQAIYFLRNALGADTIVSRTADELTLDLSTVWCDAIAFDEAVKTRRHMDAVELYRGELLAGFHVAGAGVEFAAWLDTMRAAYARQYEAVLRSIAEEREAAGDREEAVVWWRRVAAQDPLNSEAALHLMRAFAAAGDPGAAIRHARVHEALLRDELDAPPDPRIGQLIRSLQAHPPTTETPAPPAVPAPRSVTVSETKQSSPPPAGSSLPPSIAGQSETVHEQARHPGRLLRWRYASGAAVGLAVAGLSMFAFAHTRAPDVTSSCIAVIPLANYSGDLSQNDLADAITDGLITELARYQRLSVISRTSVSQYKATRKPLPEIARELGCNAVLEGSIARSGDRVLVDAQLVNAASDRHLWAEHYDRAATDLRTLERDVAEAVALQLRAIETDNRSPAGTPVGASARRVDPIIYGLYLRGRDAALSRNPAGLRLAIAMYKEAIGRDSTFALGYAGLADAYRLAGGLGYMREEFAVDSAPVLARAALALDGDLSEAHTSVAATLTDVGAWPAAEREFQRALQLAPSNALAHQWYSALLITLDRKQEALQEIRRARELDPLSQPIRGMTTLIERYLGILSPVAPVRSPIIDPNDPGPAAGRSVTLARGGRCPEAYAENTRAQQLAPDNNAMLVSLVGVRLLCGDRAGAMSLFAKVKRRSQIEVQGVYVAEVHVKLGQVDSAFAWLDRAHWGMATRMELRIAEPLKPLRVDPRYRQLLHKQNML